MGQSSTAYDQHLGNLIDMLDLSDSHFLIMIVLFLLRNGVHLLHLFLVH